MSEMLLDRESLVEKGYMPVGVDIGYSDFEQAMERYLAFLEIDEKYHDATRFYAGGNVNYDFGQFRRQPNTESHRGVVLDNKDIFHFGSQTRQVVEARLTGALPKDMKDFLDIAEDIFWESHRSKRAALEVIDSYQAGLVGICLPETGEIRDTVRFIAYYPSDDGILAKGHFDRSMATIALAESHPGLRIAPGQNGLHIDADEVYLKNLEANLQNVEYAEGQGKFFLGAGWNRLPEYYRFGNHDLPLGWHDVVKTDQQINDQLMRWAIIHFINPHAEFVTANTLVPTPAETRPYKQLGRITIPRSELARI